MDLSSGYYQFPISEDSQHITAFRFNSCPLMEFTVLPQGLKPSAAAMTRAIHDIFEEQLYKKMIAYLDDLCIYGNNFDEQFENLSEVLEKLDRHNFQINTEKTFLFQTKCELLGMSIENGKITPTLGSVQAIKDLAVPKNVKQLRGLISSFSYYRKFMKDFVNTAKPIMDLLKGKTDSKQIIKWSADCDEAFKKLKQQITSQPVLQIFDPQRETTLSVDGSSYGLGAVLAQRDPTDNFLKPVAYFSQKLPLTKKHLCSLDLELIALSKAMKHF
jgi:hypothetical protein